MENVVKSTLEKMKNDRNYHGFAHTLKEDDDRIELFTEQYNERGFDDSETWSLYNSILSYAIPRLKRFREINPCFPMGMDENEWNEIIDSIIIAFEILNNSDFIIYTVEQKKLINDGMEAFSKNITRLWW